MVVSASALLKASSASFQRRARMYIWPSASHTVRSSSVLVEQPLGHRQPFVGLALVGQFPGQHQLQVAILGVGLDGLARNFDRLVELLGVAVGVHLELVAAHRRFAAHVDQFLIGGNGLGGLVLLVIDRPQPLQEDAAIVLLLGGVSAVGVRGQVHHLLEDLRGLVEAAQHVQQQPFVIAGFQDFGSLLARLADGRQRILVLSLAALDLANVNQRARRSPGRPRPAPCIA